MLQDIQMPAARIFVLSLPHRIDLADRTGRSHWRWADG
jgi:hypothetical protein